MQETLFAPSIAAPQRMVMTMKYEFTIIASGLDPEVDEDFEDRFFEAGCDDATLSFQKGVIVLEFNREAESFLEAIATGYADALKAGAHVERIEPDHLVSLSDIARRAGLSRAAISLYVKGERGEDFPAPIARVTTESPLWNWVDVAKWLYQHKQGDLEVALQANIVSAANTFVWANNHGVTPKTEFASYLRECTASFEMELKAA